MFEGNTFAGNEKNILFSQNILCRHIFINKKQIFRKVEKLHKFR